MENIILEPAVVLLVVNCRAPFPEQVSFVAVTLSEKSANCEKANDGSKKQNNTDTRNFKQYFLRPNFPSKEAGAFIN